MSVPLASLLGCSRLISSMLMVVMSAASGTMSWQTAAINPGLALMVLFYIGQLGRMSAKTLWTLSMWLM